MKFREFGDRNRPTVILLHREGLSWWSLEGVIRRLEENYHVVAPVIDGHGEDGTTAFVSIQNSAQKLIRYIDANCRGSVFAVGGLCLGAQIAVEILSRRTDIAKYAVLESAAVCPAGKIGRLLAPVCGLFGWFAVRNRWVAGILAKRFRFPEERFDRYYRDGLGTSGKSLLRAGRASRTYSVPDGIRNTTAKVLVIVGTRELRRMDRSVRKLMSAVPVCEVCVAPGTRRGEFTLVRPMEYLALLKHLMK